MATEKLSNTSVKTIASAQPSDGSIHLVKSPKNENDETVLSSRPPISASTRYIVTLFVLITQGVVILISEKMVISKSSIFQQFGSFLSLFLAFFTNEWIRIHSFALTRQKRAFFDEVNILETYQPRARTMGHLFQPDPPTPGPVVKIAEDPNLPQRSDSEKAAFNANRDAHYANMFEYAMRVAKEQEEADKQALEAQKARLAAEESQKTATAKSASDGSTATAVPKGEPLYDDISNPQQPQGTSEAPSTASTASLPGLENVEGGTTLELPPSLREKSEDKSSKTTSPATAEGTTGTTTETQTASGNTDSNNTEGGNSNAEGVKSGKKRRKKNINQ